MLNARYDGSSNFAKNKKWAFFPSAALAWTVTEEDFLSALKDISKLKIRASYGITGNQAIQPYQSLASFTDVFATDHGKIVPAIRPLSLANPNLTIANFEEAYKSAKWVIDNKAELNYDLEADYQDLWRADKQDFSKEYIFAVDFLGNMRGDNDAPNYTLENDHEMAADQGVEGGAKPFRGWSMLVPSLKVYSEWDPRDYRRKVCIDDSLMLTDDVIHPYTDFEVPRPHAAKFSRFCGVRKSSTAGWRSEMNFVVYRYAEVLLIAAEAANEIGKTEEGSNYVNEVRERTRRGGIINFDGNGYGSFGPSAFPADVPAGMSREDFRTLVLEERRIELAFEYKRWYDIKRRDLGDDVFGVNGREPQPGFDKTKHYLLPIPKKELDISPNLNPQNTGY